MDYKGWRDRVGHILVVQHFELPLSINSLQKRRMSVLFDVFWVCANVASIEVIEYHDTLFGILGSLCQRWFQLDIVKALREYAEIEAAICGKVFEPGIEHLRAFRQLRPCHLVHLRRGRNTGYVVTRSNEVLGICPGSRSDIEDPVHFSRHRPDSLEQFFIIGMLSCA